MMSIVEFVKQHAVRGECQCGRCLDSKGDSQPKGHVADLVFFKVAAQNEPDVEKLKQLVANKAGEFCEVDLLDGKEHGYMEIGGWIGDQGLALTLMGLGSILGLWTLLTPKTVFGNLIDDDMQMQMAGSGMVSIKAN